MGEPYMGEIRLFSGSFAPSGWALCNGQTLSIQQYQALYTVLGTAYGGDGVTKFQLPNLQGRVPINFGQGTGLSPYTLGQMGGSESVPLTSDQLPPHLHTVQVPVNNTEGDTSDPTNAYLSVSTNDQYAPKFTPGAGGPLLPTTASGAGAPHPNIQPTLCVNFIISLQGVYPSRS